MGCRIGRIFFGGSGSKVPKHVYCVRWHLDFHLSTIRFDLGCPKAISWIPSEPSKGSQIWSQPSDGDCIHRFFYVLVVTFGGMFH